MSQIPVHNGNGLNLSDRMQVLYENYVEEMSNALEGMRNNGEENTARYRHLERHHNVVLMAVIFGRRPFDSSEQGFIESVRNSILSWARRVRNSQ